MIFKWNTSNTGTVDSQYRDILHHPTHQWLDLLDLTLNLKILKIFPVHFPVKRLIKSYGTKLVTNFWSYGFHLRLVLSDLQLTFNFWRNDQKAILEANLDFDSRFKKYAVIEFWPYLSWFWSTQHFSEILQVCSNLTKLDQVGATFKILENCCYFKTMKDTTKIRAPYKKLFSLSNFEIYCQRPNRPLIWPFGLFLKDWKTTVNLKVLV
jgi:hypothetical protein